MSYYWTLSKDASRATLYWYNETPEIFNILELKAEIEKTKKLRYISKTEKNRKIRCLEEGLELLNG